MNRPVSRELWDNQRIADIDNAIKDLIGSRNYIPAEWVHERNELIGQTETLEIYADSSLEPIARLIKMSDQ